MMLMASIVALLVAMVLILARAFLGVTIYDRLLAANSFGTLIILLITVYGFFTGRPDFLDIAIVYALINYIGTIALLKFFESDRPVNEAYEEDDF